MVRWFISLVLMLFTTLAFGQHRSSANLRIVLTDVQRVMYKGEANDGETSRDHSRLEVSDRGNSTWTVHSLPVNQQTDFKRLLIRDQLPEATGKLAKPAGSERINKAGISWEELKESPASGSPASDKTRSTTLIVYQVIPS